MGGGEEVAEEYAEVASDDDDEAGWSEKTWVHLELRKVIFFFKKKVN